MSFWTHRGAAVLALAIFSGFWPRPVLAQTVSSTLEGAFVNLKPGQLVFVENDSGERVKGKLFRLSFSEIVLRTDGPLGGRKPFATDRVARISKIDSRRNGFLIGLAAGAVPGLLLGRTFNELCKNESPDYCPSAFLIFGGLLSVGGGWIGWEVDDLVTRETLIFSRQGNKRSGPAPRLGGNRHALLVNVRF